MADRFLENRHKERNIIVDLGLSSTFRTTQKWGKEAREQIGQNLGLTIAGTVVAVILGLAIPAISNTLVDNDSSSSDTYQTPAGQAVDYSTGTSGVLFLK